MDHLQVGNAIECIYLHCNHTSNSLQEFFVRFWNSVFYACLLDGLYE